MAQVCRNEIEAVISSKTKRTTPNKIWMIVPVTGK
jgi:hypothetical protein